MSFDADQVFERRRLKRRLALWRVLGIAAVVAAVVAVAGWFDLVGSQDRIARIMIAGIIVDDQTRDQALKTVADDEKIKALIVKIDSPGAPMSAARRSINRFAGLPRKNPWSP